MSKYGSWRYSGHRATQTITSPSFGGLLSNKQLFSAAPPGTTCILRLLDLSKKPRLDMAHQYSLASGRGAKPWFDNRGSLHRGVQLSATGE